MLHFLEVNIIPLLLSYQLHTIQYVSMLVNILDNLNLTDIFTYIGLHY